MKAIVTDYDYTLSDKFLTVELLFLLEQKGVIKGYKNYYMLLREDYDKGKVSYNSFVNKDMSFIKKYLKDVSYLDVLKIIREDFDVEKNLFDWSKEIRKMFPSEEWIFIVISSTMDLCLEEAQEILDFDTYFCSSYEVKDGKFTGEFNRQVKSKEKGDYIKKLSKDLEKVVVIGDAPGDFEMMKCSSSCFLFEPNAHSMNEFKTAGIDCEIVNRKNILSFLEKEI